jgi:hypothetical protein
VLSENWEHVRNPSQAEFRSEVVTGEFPRAFSEDTAFWEYLLAPATVSPLGGTVPLLEPEEHVFFRRRQTVQAPSSSRLRSTSRSRRRDVRER